MKHLISFNEFESLNEARKIQLKRKYGERKAVTAGLRGPVRNRILGKIAESENGKLTRKELKEFIASMNEDTGRKTSFSWVNRNSRYFKTIRESDGSVSYTLSKLGRRVLNRSKLDENKLFEGGERTLKRAIDALDKEGIDDYPGGDTDANGLAYLIFDTPEDAKEALEVLKKRRFKAKISKGAGNSIVLENFEEVSVTENEEGLFLTEGATNLAAAKKMDKINKVKKGELGAEMWYGLSAEQRKELLSMILDDIDQVENEMYNDDFNSLPDVAVAYFQRKSPREIKQIIQ